MSTSITKSIAKRIAHLAQAIDIQREEGIDSYELEQKISRLEEERDQKIGNLNTDGTMSSAAYDKKVEKIEEVYQAKIDKVQEEVDRVEALVSALENTVASLYQAAEELVETMEVEFDVYDC